MIHRTSHSCLSTFALGAALFALGCPSQQPQGGPPVTHANENGIIPEAPAAEATQGPQGPQGPKTTTGPGWDAVRKVLFHPDNCFGYKLDFCVQDSEFVNPLIQGVLDKWYGGVMPDDAQKIEAVGKSSKSRYLEALQSPDGLRRIEKLVEDRFNHPEVTKKDGAVIIDYGYLPTKLSIYRNRIAGGGASDHLEGNQWKSSEVGQAFKKALAENPQAQTITLLIDIPSISTSPRWTYAYDKVADRVVIWTPATIQGAYLTGALHHDFEPFITGKATLQTGQLTYDRGFSSSH
jgi:hypothetical protein